MHGRDLEPAEDDPSGASSLPAPNVSITRRRLALLVAGLFGLWLIGVFARQVGEASAAASQADEMRARNAAIERDIASLEEEIKLVKQPAYVAQAARAYLLGSPLEIPFTLDPNAPPLPAGSPGSVGIKPDAQPEASSPLDSWLTVLFGSQ
jgi:cell division protein FtsB